MASVEALDMVLLQEILAPVGHEAVKPENLLYQLQLRIILVNLRCHFGNQRVYLLDCCIDFSINCCKARVSASVRPTLAAALLASWEPCPMSFLLKESEATCDLW